MADLLSAENIIMAGGGATSLVVGVAVLKAKLASLKEDVQKNRDEAKEDFRQLEKTALQNRADLKEDIRQLEAPLRRELDALREDKASVEAVRSLDGRIERLEGAVSQIGHDLKAGFESNKTHLDDKVNNMHFDLKRSILNEIAKQKDS